MDGEEFSDHPTGGVWPVAYGVIPVEPDVSALLGLALEVVAEAADLAASARAWAVSRVATKSNAVDVVTEADRAAERLVVSRLSAARPGDVFVGEEGGGRGSAGPGVVRWIVDPIDGTVNYVYGLPFYAVSLAAEVDGRLLVGVVRNIATGQVWHALAGGGAFRDGEPVVCNGVVDLGQALLATGFAYDAGLRARQGAVVAGVLPRVRDIRRTGSAALDLCMVADGTVDAYYERGPNVWDYAAGAVIAAEAGAVVGGLRSAVPDSSLILAAAPGVYEELREVLVAERADRD